MLKSLKIVNNSAKTRRETAVIQVKVFDYEHEKDLEDDMNKFLEDLDEKKLVDIKYNVAAYQEDEDEQIYCFSAMVIYRA